MMPNRSFNYFFGGAGVPPMTQLPPQLQQLSGALRNRFQGIGDAIRSGYQQQTGQPFPFQPGQWGGTGQPLPTSGMGTGQPVQPQGLPFGMGTGQMPSWGGLQGLMSRFMPPQG